MTSQGDAVVLIRQLLLAESNEELQELIARLLPRMDDTFFAVLTEAAEVESARNPAVGARRFPCARSYEKLQDKVLASGKVASCLLTMGEGLLREPRVPHSQSPSELCLPSFAVRPLSRAIGPDRSDLTSGRSYCIILVISSIVEPVTNQGG